jgi:hypothetical protein
LPFLIEKSFDLGESIEVTTQMRRESRAIFFNLGPRDFIFQVHLPEGETEALEGARRIDSAFHILLEENTTPCFRIHLNDESLDQISLENVVVDFAILGDKIRFRQMQVRCHLFDFFAVHEDVPVTLPRTAVTAPVTMKPDTLAGFNYF